MGYPDTSPDIKKLNDILMQIRPYKSPFKLRLGKMVQNQFENWMNNQVSKPIKPSTIRQYLSYIFNGKHFPIVEVYFKQKVILPELFKIASSPSHCYIVPIFAARCLHTTHFIIQILSLSLQFR